MTVSSYNTRRKSVSLASLGIHVPNSSRSSSTRSIPATSTTTTSPSNITTNEDAPPTKKLKRSSTSSSSISNSSASIQPPSRPRKSSSSLATHLKSDRLPQIGGRIAETTPPPSPGDAGTSQKVDIQGINDDIVVAVIQQLEKTGNRPHLLKELANVLQYTVSIVETSANQPAIISSRLTNYMKRPWTALSPCPLGKELVGTHPKRIYFFLNTQPRQDFPEPSDIQLQPRIISPSLTSNENDNEMDEACDRRRSEMSPSPEVDLSYQDLDNDDDRLSASDSFADLQVHHSQSPSTASFSQQRTCPTLEGVEREFTETYNHLLKRRTSEALEQAAKPATTEPAFSDFVNGVDFTFAGDHHNVDTSTLFGYNAHLTAPETAYLASSPMVQPQSKDDIKPLSLGKPIMTAVTLTTSVQDAGITWSDLPRTETVELDELDDLFAGY